MARSEVERLTAEQQARLERIRVLLLPKDPNDDKNVIVEVRAGTGGDEAGLFAADLLRMYSRWAETHGYKVSYSAERDRHRRLQGSYLSGARSWGIFALEV